MGTTAEQLLERALLAEEARDSAMAELEDLRGRLRAALGADPSTAVSALAVIVRCDQAEDLIEAVLWLVDHGDLRSTLLPEGWVPIARAQMKAKVLAQRAGEMLERPADTDYWEKTLTPQGRAQVRIDRDRRRRRGN